AGSGWRDYEHTGAVCGHQLPEGLRQAERLPTPIFTPATKASEGHDENISREAAAEIVGADTLGELERITLALYERAAAACRSAGIILADTKFELGSHACAEIVLGDEVLTPDSSRYWPADLYEPGKAQPSFDKQFVRDWANAAGWDHTPPAPELPDDVVAQTQEKYREAFERITGTSFSGASTGSSGDRR
ncbi:MAG: phosphoribosylaminoimidazolesuccinocarboxamide synthase, partial [Acidobacteriota bacterium]